MIHIVVERSKGFGGGGWETGYITYIISQGEIIATNKEKYNNSKFVAKVLRHLGFKYRWHRIDTINISGQRKGELLFERLLRETEEEKS